MSNAKFEPRVDEAATLLLSMRHAIDAALQSGKDMQLTADWISLIEAASSQAHYLLTGKTIEEAAK